MDFAFPTLREAQCNCNLIMPPAISITFLGSSLSFTSSFGSCLFLEIVLKRGQNMQKALIYLGSCIQKKSLKQAVRWAPTERRFEHLILLFPAINSTIKR